MRRILLLEDDMILQEIIEEFLLDKGYEVETFYDGEKALDAAMKGHYDMLLLDVNVPEVDGFEMLGYLREISDRTPAIFMTSLSDLKNLKKGFRSWGGGLPQEAFRSRRTAYPYRASFAAGGGGVYPVRSLHVPSPSPPPRGPGRRQGPPQSQRVGDPGYLLRRREEVVSFDELIANVWEEDQEPAYATIRTYIKNLRKALGYSMIENVKGEGSLFTFDFRKLRV
jgi:two-component system OmpR family response regulator